MQCKEEKSKQLDVSFNLNAGKVELWGKDLAW